MHKIKHTKRINDKTALTLSNSKFFQDNFNSKYRARRGISNKKSSLTTKCQIVREYKFSTLLKLSLSYFFFSSLPLRNEEGTRPFLTNVQGSDYRLSQMAKFLKFKFQEINKLILKLPINLPRPVEYLSRHIIIALIFNQKRPFLKLILFYFWKLYLGIWEHWKIDLTKAIVGIHEVVFFYVQHILHMACIRLNKTWNARAINRVDESDTFHVRRNYWIFK